MFVPPSGKYELQYCIHTKVWLYRIHTKVWLCCIHTKVWLCCIHTKVWLYCIHTKVWLYRIQTKYKWIILKSHIYISNKIAAQLVWNDSHHIERYSTLQWVSPNRIHDSVQLSFNLRIILISTNNGKQHICLIPTKISV